MSNASDMAPSGLVVQHVEVVTKLSRMICRRHGLTAEDAEDFASHVQLKLIEDDYSIVRQFRGESSFTSYLSVVVAMVFRDYRAAVWGRWRPSAVARRLGEVAVMLETLTYRDGVSLTEAGELIRSRGHPDMSDRELGRLLRELPRRAPLRPLMVPEETISNSESAAQADNMVLQKESDADEQDMVTKVGQVVGALPGEDRLMVKMHLLDGLTLAQVSRSIGVPQKPMYRRMERILRTMREQLEHAGVTWTNVSAIMERADR